MCSVAQPPQKGTTGSLTFAGSVLSDLQASVYAPYEYPIQANVHQRSLYTYQPYFVHLTILQPYTVLVPKASSIHAFWSHKHSCQLPFPLPKQLLSYASLKISAFLENKNTTNPPQRPPCHVPLAPRRSPRRLELRLDDLLCREAILEREARPDEGRPFWDLHLQKGGSITLGPKWEESGCERGGRRRGVSLDLWSSTLLGSLTKHSSCIVPCLETLNRKCSPKMLVSWLPKLPDLEFKTDSPKQPVTKCIAHETNTHNTSMMPP